MANDYPYMPEEVTVKTVLDGVTSDTTSNAIPVQGAKKVALYLEQASTNSTEEGEFSVDISFDGTNFVDFNMLIDNTSDTNSENLTRVASKTLTADGSAVVFMEPKALGSIVELKVSVAVTNSDKAEFTAKVAIMT